jgi:predicted NBD/HSP70 family sugar kinase
MRALMAYIGSDIKGMNRRIVYELLCCKGELSRAEISRITGISAPTVLKIVDYLQRIGCVREVGEGESPLGRKPNILQFDAGFSYAVGVNFSGVDVDIGITDFSGTICYMRHLPVIPDFEKVLKEILPAEIRNIIAASNIASEKIRGICIGLPGVINPEKKTIGLAPLVGIRDRKDYSWYISDLSCRLGMPVRFENDANMAAIGEFRARNFTPRDDLLFITIGKGLGAGLILNGKLRTGKHFFAGELGYMVFDRDFRARRDQAGWLETASRLDTVYSERNHDMTMVDVLAANLALAVVNICISVDVTDVVLGKIRNEAFYRQLIQRTDYYLHRLCTLDINFSIPVSKEPTITGCAHTVIDSEVDRLFDVSET